MKEILSALEQLAAQQRPEEPMWLIDGVHEATRSTWIAVASTGEVQRRTRAIDALPSSTGRGREDFDVEVIGRAGPDLLGWLAQTLLSCGLRELASLAPVPDGPRYTLKIALGKQRFDLSVDQSRLRSHDHLRTIHEAFCWLGENVSRDEDDDEPPTAIASFPGSRG